MKILIIGGSGFIGSHLADALIGMDYNVTVLDLKKKWFNNKCKYIKGNILNYNSLVKLIKNFDVVYNFAALADIDISRRKPLDTAKINIIGSINIFKACLKNKVKKIIHASTIYVDSNEGSFYAISKRAAEEYLIELDRINKINYTILRFGSLYGERADNNNAIQRLINSIKKKRKLFYRGSSKAARKYIYVKDAVFLCIKVISKKFDRKCYIITGRKKMKISYIFRVLKKKLNIFDKPIYLNEANTGHYIHNPQPHKLNIGRNLFLMKETNFFSKIMELIKK